MNFHRYIQPLSRLILLAVLASGFSPSLVVAATYNQRNIDGKRFNAQAFSYATGRWYDVQVQFSGDQASIYFPRGGRLIVVIDDEEIDDLDEISAFDYNRAEHWTIDID